MKKKYVLFFMALGIGFLIMNPCKSTYADEVESKVTVRIIREETIDSESIKDKDTNLDKTINKKNKVTKVKNKLPRTNEITNSSISIIGTLILSIGIFGIYINNKRNGAKNNEKN